MKGLLTDLIGAIILTASMAIPFIFYTYGG